MTKLSILRDSESWTVGVTETCSVLANFETHDEAAEYIGDQPEAELGIYYIDPPDEWWD